MKSLLLLSSFFFILGCDDGIKDEIYNENNTTVSGGVVYDTDEQPINGLYRVYYPNGIVKMEIQSKVNRTGTVVFITKTENCIFKELLSTVNLTEQHIIILPTVVFIMK